MFEKFYQHTRRMSENELEVHLRFCARSGKCRDIQSLFKEAGHCGFDINNCRPVVARTTHYLTSPITPVHHASTTIVSDAIIPKGIDQLSWDKKEAAIRKLNEEALLRRCWT